MKKIVGIIMLMLSFVVFGNEQEKYNQYKTEKLISASMAREIIETNENVVVIDVRTRAKFMLGNVSGSNNLWRPDMESQDGRFGDVTGMRASREEMETELRKIGVDNDTTIILVGENLDEYRLWWILDLYNGAQNVRIVDGGISAFRGAGISRIAQRTNGNFSFPAGENNNTLATFENVKENLKKSTHIILDTRSAAEQNGEVVRSGAALAGAIPSEFFVEFSRALNDGGTMKSYDELVALYKENGVTPNKVVIAYCQSGVRSAFSTFVLKELIGYPTVLNYDGSWIEWSQKASLDQAPIINGADKGGFWSYLTDRKKMEGFIKGLGIWGPLAYIAIYALVTITCFSVLPVTIVGGLVFGPVLGILYTAIGASLGLSLAFLISRYIARGFIERKFGQTDAFKKIDDGVRNEGWFILATTRLLPIFPFGIQNYVYGLTSIKFVQYAVLSTIFILPGTAVFVMLAGAVASGDTATATKYAIIASLIFFALTVITKIIAKKSKSKEANKEEVKEIEKEADNK